MVRRRTLLLGGRVCAVMLSCCDPVRSIDVEVVISNALRAKCERDWCCCLLFIFLETAHANVAGWLKGWHLVATEDV